MLILRLILLWMVSLHKEGNRGIDQHKSCSQSDVNYFNDETVERVWSSIQSIHSSKVFLV